MAGIISDIKGRCPLISSCWIIRAGCLGETFNSARFRITDDCGNWTRSENMVPETEMSIVITNPPAESEFEFGVPVFFDAEIIPSNAYPGMEERIKWSILVEENSVWVDYGPHEEGQYLDWEDKTDSFISLDEDWLGPNFEIESFEDCDGLRVRARLEMCETVYDDICTIYVEGTRSGQSLFQEIQDIAFVVENEDMHLIGYPDGGYPPNHPEWNTIEESLSGYWLIRNPGDKENLNAPMSRIIERPVGFCELGCAVMIESIVNPELIDLLDDQIVISASSPTDEITGDSGECDVALTIVDPLSSRHQILYGLFEAQDEGCKYHYFYECGPEVQPPYQTTPMLLISDNSESKDWNEGGPILQLNDRYNDVQDYAVIASTHSADWGGIVNSSDSLYYGEKGSISNKRGVLKGSYNIGLYLQYKDEYPETHKSYYYFDLHPTIFCKPDEGILPCYKSDVFECGFEIVQIKIDDFEANIGVQSRAKVLFIMQHGVHYGYDIKSAPKREDYEEQDAYDLAWTTWHNQIATQGIGPFYPSDFNTSLSHWIDYKEIPYFSSLGKAKTIVTTSCGLLSDKEDLAGEVTWKKWYDQLNVDNLDTICGFSGLSRHRNLDSKFWDDFSRELTEDETSTNSGYWASGASSSNSAVIAWMENGCEKSRIFKDHNFDPTLSGISAIDLTGKYYLKRAHIWGLDMLPEKFYIFHGQY